MPRTFGKTYFLPNFCLSSSSVEVEMDNEVTPKSSKKKKDQTPLKKDEIGIDQSMFSSSSPRDKKFKGILIF